jgi:hypothetical protein
MQDRGHIYIYIYIYSLVYIFFSQYELRRCHVYFQALVFGQMGPNSISLPLLFIAAWVGNLLRDYQLPRVPATLDIGSVLSRVESIGAAAVAACDRVGASFAGSACASKSAPAPPPPPPPSPAPACAPCPPPECPVVLNLTAEYGAPSAEVSASIGSWTGPVTGAAGAAVVLGASAFGRWFGGVKQVVLLDQPDVDLAPRPPRAAPTLSSLTVDGSSL